MLNRKEAYLKLLRAKGGYFFICGTNLDIDEFYHVDDKHVFKKIITRMLEGHNIILHFVFPFDLKRGYEVYPFVKEKVFAWNSKKEEFELIEEKYICEGKEYNSIRDFDYLVIT